jgi:F-type H+-transporting ATPase subunit b
MNPILVDALSSAVTLLFLWVVLGKGLLKPFFDLVDERDRRTSGDEQVAVDHRTKARQLTAEIEQKLSQVRLEAITKRDERVQKARQEAQQIIDRAAEQAAAELKKGQQEIAQLKTRALTELEVESDRLSSQVVGRVLESGPSMLMH